MIKLLNDVLPVGAPWGGPESNRYVSSFVSLLMQLDSGCGEESLYCTQDDGLCSRCGDCGPFEPGNKKHEELYHLYLTVSGLSCFTIWRDDLNGRYFSDLPLQVFGGAYIDRTMDFAGCSYKFLHGSTKEDLSQGVMASIDGGIPLLAYGVAGSDWSIVTGYEDGCARIFGRYAPQKWDPAERLPDAVDAGGVFVKSDWYHPKALFLAVTGRKAPSRDFGELFRYLPSVLWKPDATGCISGIGAYDACIDRLSDEDFFTDADENAMARFFRFLHEFFGMLAENRCFAAFVFRQSFFGLATGMNGDWMRTIGAYFMDTHNRCRDAWAAMGADHVCRPELHAEAMRSADARQKVIGIVKTIRQNDMMAMQLMRDCERIGRLLTQK